MFYMQDFYLLILYDVSPSYFSQEFQKIRSFINYIDTYTYTYIHKHNIHYITYITYIQKLQSKQGKLQDKERPLDYNMGMKM